MLQFGQKITQVGDPLHKISVERLYKGIAQPKAAFRDKIIQLRTVKEVDERQYRELKKHLPYFVCGLFHPAIRRKEHFASIRYFVLDIDHLAAAAIDQQELRRKLENIPEVLMVFASPSNDGLKVMFKLKEACADAAYYSSFYKLFAHQFAQKYELAQVLDFKTSDVSRACFMSWDEAAYLNTDALAVDAQALLAANDFGAAAKDLKAAENFVKEQGAKHKKEHQSSVDEQTLRKIKLALNPNARLRVKKEYINSPEVEKIIPWIKEHLTSYHLELTAYDKLNYGKKLRIASNDLWAEINLFYGAKKGFTIVKTTKAGSHKELADLAAKALAEILLAYEQAQLPTENESKETL